MESRIINHSTPGHRASTTIVGNRTPYNHGISIVSMLGLAIPSRRLYSDPLEPPPVCGGLVRLSLGFSQKHSPQMDGNLLGRVAKASMKSSWVISISNHSRIGIFWRLCGLDITSGGVRLGEYG